MASTGGVANRTARVVSGAMDTAAAEALGDQGRAEPELVASGGGGKAETEAGLAGGDKRRSSPPHGVHALEEEIPGGSNVQLSGGPRRTGRKVMVNRRKMLKVDEVEAQNDMDQAQCWCNGVKDAACVSKENEKLRSQLASKEKKLEEQKRTLELEAMLEEWDMETRQKQNEELKTENENPKSTEKPHKTRRLCRSTITALRGVAILRLMRKRQSHQEPQGYAGRVENVCFMTTATAQRGVVPLVLLKKRQSH